VVTVTSGALLGAAQMSAQIPKYISTSGSYVDTVYVSGYTSYTSYTSYYTSYNSHYSSVPPP
jgi:hypothetical protein